MRIFNKSAWNKKELQEAVERQLQKSITFAPNSRIDGVLVEPVTVETGKQDVHLIVVGSADPEGPAYEENYEVAVTIQGNRCPQCEKLSNQYFTGILQLRRPNDPVQNEIERLLGKAMSAVKDVTGGIDYYVTDHRILQNVARQVHAQFGGELSINAQHFSYDSLASKNLYRVNALLRLPKYWKGSVIQAGTKIFYITNMGKMLKGVDVQTGKVLSVPANNDYAEYPLYTTSIVTSRPSVTVLDPETFQTIPIQNERDEWNDLQPGDKVVVSVVEDQIFLVAKE
jgi:NMD protein affecting ribosome stability and mRNA decay